MSVEFDDQRKASALYAKFQSSDQEPALVRWVISSGIVKTADQANIVLVAITILALILAVVIFYKTNAPANSGFTPEQLQSIQRMNQGILPTQQ